MIGPCPKCAGRVFEQPMSYLCENSVWAEKRCDFRSGKVILQQPIDATQMAKLLNEGRTDLLRGFVSNRTRRKFSALLVRKPDGTTGFEFEPRAPKAAKSAKPGGKPLEPVAVANGAEIDVPSARRRVNEQPCVAGAAPAAPAKKASSSRKRASVVSGAAVRVRRPQR